MTRYDHIVTMSKRPGKSVKVAELKAQLSAYLRAARAGHHVTVCDHEPLVVRRPTRALRDVKLPKTRGRRVNSLAALLDERQSSR